MQIELTAAQKSWLEARVADGDYPSIEAAARGLIDDGMAAFQAGAGADLSWARPLIKQGLEALARGDTISLDEHKARNADRLAAAGLK